MSDPTMTVDDPTMASLADDAPDATDWRPAAPRDLADTGIAPAVLMDLALRAAATVPQFTTEWAARLLGLPTSLTGELLEQLRTDHMLDILGSSGPFGYRYAASNRGRERAARLLEVSGYVGPAPVSLEAYSAAVERQFHHAPEVRTADVEAALAALILPDESRLMAGLTASSGRSLFVYGPPGNGKTSLGRALHSALRGDIWVPHCIGIESTIIRIYDEQLHRPAAEPLDAEAARGIDRRWVRVRRPLIVVGGELTIQELDLAYSPSLRFYEAPLQVKANNGTFLIDDFGRQRIAPRDLLNRWIVPLEHQRDFLTLFTGQKLEVPFRMRLIFATNLSPADVTDPAFLRRMGYRLLLPGPSPEGYATIFGRYAADHGLEVPAGLVEHLLDRYDREGRELKSCDPRDLIERACDLRRYRGLAPGLDRESLDVAWSGYFGHESDTPAA